MARVNPLLNSIAGSESNVESPVIDRIDEETDAYYHK